MDLSESRIAVIGLGYVGLPLALEFAKLYPTLGFDISEKRIAELLNGDDRTLECASGEIQKNLKKSADFEQSGFYLTAVLNDIKDCNIFIVTVPTAIDSSKKPDLQPLKTASKMIGSVLKKNDLVIYESTTFPGCTEEICVPILENASGLKFNSEFFVGYSPERINPGDKINTITKIKKVTSGSNDHTADFVDNLYSTIIEAGTYKAKSIKVAEAAKAIENAQRDLNISFVNELSIIFEKLGIDTHDVLDTASTKWNFLKYKPGLVGGHCIGVDPYYLAFRAEQAGYQPNVILSGRRVNDNMGIFVANKVVKLMISKEIDIKNSRVLILGLTFKENCPDFRNTKVIDIYNELQDFGCKIDLYDPWVNPQDAKRDYGILIQNDIDNSEYDAIILAVAHDAFSEINLGKIKKENSVIYDCKGVLDRDLIDARL